MVILRRNNMFLRPLYYFKTNGKPKEIENIKIFDGNKIYETRSGFLTSNGRDIELMEFEKLPVKRNIDLTLNYSFLANDLTGEFTLFLYIPDIKSTVYLKHESMYDLENWYYRKLEFIFNGEQITLDLFDHAEDLPERQKAEKLAMDLNAICGGKRFTEYDTIKILKHYKLIKRRA